MAIRTLALYPGGEAVLNVGGGVVADSTAAAEYEEALWKARFADLFPRPDADRDLPLGARVGFVRLPAHLARLAGGAAALKVGLDRREIERALAGVAGAGAAGAADAGAGRGGRGDGCAARAGTGRMAVRSPAQRLASGRSLAPGEADAAARYDAARAALAAGVDEAILLNERGEVARGRSPPSSSAGGRVGDAAACLRGCCPGCCGRATRARAPAGRRC